MPEIDELVGRNAGDRQIGAALVQERGFARPPHADDTDRLVLQLREGHQPASELGRRGLHCGQELVPNNLLKLVFHAGLVCRDLDV
jgi:hypothetical protein